MTVDPAVDVSLPVVNDGCLRRSTLAALLALGLAACGGGAAGGGEAADSRAPRERVISLIPAATEIILAMNARNLLVARSDFDVDPRLDDLPSVGRALTPSLERLAMLSPDLVVAWPDNTTRSVIARLRDLGVDVYSPEIQNLADIRRTTLELGRLLEVEAAADSLVTAMESELEAVRRAVAGRPKPDVFYVVWLDPPTTTGPGTYIHELIGLAGGRNVFEDAPGMWPQVSIEAVIRRDPDVVLIARTEEAPVDLDRLRERPGWREIDAVEEGRVVAVDADLFNRPGPRVTAAAHRLAVLLHPGLRVE